MRTETLIKKIRLEIVRNNYDLPGGMGRLASEIGISQVSLSKALHGHYKEVYRRMVLERVLEFFGR